MSASARPYRGRLAPTPSGPLHAGHAATFRVAAARAARAGGALILRIDDLDPDRCAEEFTRAAIEDLRWLGIDWQEGPDRGGPHAPYRQSQRTAHYRAALERLRATGHIYPCVCSRRDIAEAARAPHAADDGEPVYPGTCRDRLPDDLPDDTPRAWRFRVPDGAVVSFVDQAAGPRSFRCGQDFGDFPVWRKDGIPAYHLATVVDDIAMGITEVVRGEDLLVSTARHILLLRALGARPPAFVHCPLLTDRDGQRLAKRSDALSLRALRRRGVRPDAIPTAPPPPTRARGRAARGNPTGD